MKKQKLSVQCFIMIVMSILVGMTSIFILTNSKDKIEKLESITGQKECYLILAGRETTKDGSVLTAHNNDLPGNNASLIEKIPAQQHNLNEVIQFPSGLKIPQVEETYEWMVLKIYRGFEEGDAIAINEFQVSIAGGVALGSDRNENAEKYDPLVKVGLTGGVRYVALSRSKTARECVETIGNLYTKYGVTYPSGVGIADPNEIWYIESGGGYSWAAVRVPDDRYFLAANGYRIGEINPDDIDNVILSPELLKFVDENNMRNPGEPFNFAKIFGGKKFLQPELEFYDSRRLWAGIRLLSPSMRINPDAKGEEIPMFFIPDEKISISKLISVLRDHYQETPYDIYLPSDYDKKERAIAVQNCVHTDVVQLRNWIPEDVGAVLWAGFSSPYATPYIPFYFGINDFPQPYKTAGSDYDPNSSFWIYRTISSLVTPYYYDLINDVLPVWEQFETGEFTMQSAVEETAVKLYKENRKLARNYLTSYTTGLSLQSLEIAKTISNNLRRKIAEKSYTW